VSQRIRVVFVITQFDTGGVQFQLWLRLKHLDLERYDCRVAVLTDGSSYLLDRVRSLGVPVDFLHIDAERALWRRVGTIRDYFARLRPDVVDTLLTWDSVYGTIAAALARVPLIVTELQNHRISVRRGYTLAFRALEAFALRLLSDQVVCCSQAVHRSYARAIPGLADKSSVIHDAIDIEQTFPYRADARRALGLPLDVPIVGTIGRFTEQKDHDTLLRAARRLVDRQPHSLVAIVGYGPLHERLLEQCDRLGLADHVRFLGEITDPYAFYAAVDVFVMTSRWEGFPVVILEAMTAGRPVVSTRVGGIAEAIEQGRSGFLSEPGDDEGLAAAMAQLVADETLRARLGAAARQDVERYSIQRLAGKWTRLYESSWGQGAGHAAAPAELPEGAQTARPETASLPSHASRILLWRLCPLPRLLQLASDLRQRFPDATIECVCQTSVAGRLEKAGVRPIPYGEGRFSPLRLGGRQLVQLRRRDYDLVLLPFNEPTRHGYATAEVCAIWAGRGVAFGVAAWSGHIELIDSLSWASFVRTRWLSSPRHATDLIQSGSVLVRSVLSARRRTRVPVTDTVGPP
jgi:glycosyltransferase involved in cell wall biosynthesis